MLNKYDYNFKITAYKFVYKFSNENNLNKDLCILINNNNHYKLIFSKKHRALKNDNNELILNSKEYKNKRFKHKNNIL